MQAGTLGILLLKIMFFACKSQNLINVQVEIRACRSENFLKFDKICCIALSFGIVQRLSNLDDSKNFALVNKLRFSTINFKAL